MALQSPPLQPHFDRILNFRDVGLTVNSLSSGQTALKPHMLYRSARPDDASPRDRRLLAETYRIRTIIDLRSKTELIEAEKKRSYPAASSSPKKSSHDSTASVPRKIPQVNYSEISLNGKAFERALVWQLSWSSLGKLIGFMTLGYRTEAISIIGREVMQPRGLTGLGFDTLEYSRQEIKDVFTVLCQKESYPVMIHCTQGKDRTGLIILLVLCLCGVEESAIAEDYTQSEIRLLPEKEDRMKEIESIGLDESFAGCPAGFVRSTLDHIEQRYGGVEKYLQETGVSTEMQQLVLGILTQKEAP